MRTWLKPERMAALNVSPTQVRQALAANNYLSAVGQTKGSLVQVNLTAATDLKSVDEFKQARRPPARRHARAPRGRRRRRPRRRGHTTRTCVLAAERAVFMGIWVLPNANSLDVIARVRDEMKHDPDASCRPACRRAIGLRLDAVHRQRIHEVVHTLIETLLIVVVVIFLFLGSLRSVLVPVVAIPSRSSAPYS